MFIWFRLKNSVTSAQKNILMKWTLTHIKPWERNLSHASYQSYGNQSADFSLKVADLGFAMGKKKVNKVDVLKIITGNYG